MMSAQAVAGTMEGMIADWGQAFVAVETARRSAAVLDEAYDSGVRAVHRVAAALRAERQAHARTRAQVEALLARVEQAEGALQALADAGVI